MAGRLWLFVAIVLLAVVPLAAGAYAAGAEYQGTAGDDVIHGNTFRPAASEIYGMAGNDRIWGGRGYDEVHGGPGKDRLHDFQAGAGGVYGGRGWDVCVIGEKPGGSTNVSVQGCEKVVYRSSQGHG
jgi:RTX calcium-binding nonapeptide repeat (4 copies)